MKKCRKECKNCKCRKILQANSNVSLDRKLDGREYTGWLLNHVNEKGILYFFDTYGGKWKLQRLKGNLYDEKIST